MRAQHLVTVWNPTYATNALEAHVRVLLDWARRTDVEPDDVYVWWGKVKSSQRQQAMPHLAEVLALSPRDGDEAEVHLYLTDYRSLYVASVDCIETVDPRESDAAHVPDYYQREGLQCDCWFLLRDIRLLVRDDLEGVANELRQLRNVRYGDRPVSLYGGMVDLPLLVAREAPRTYFDPVECLQLTDGTSWALFDSERGGVGAMEAMLRMDHFGEQAWNALDGTARRFVAMAESTLRQHRDDHAADLSAVAVLYGKALEVQLMVLLRAGLVGLAEVHRFVLVDGASRLLPDALPLTLSPLVAGLSDDHQRAQHLTKVFKDGAWLVFEAAAAIAGFAHEARNPAAHGDTVPRAVVLRWRNQLLGVGCDGVLPRLARIRRT
jgi:hypothetical protein